MKQWNNEDIEKLKSIYSDISCSEIANVLCRDICSVYNMAFKLRLKKSKQYLKSNQSGRLNKLSASGMSYRFKKGQTPPNKGKKWNDFMSEKGQKNSQKTTFKKDHIPTTTKYFGKPYLVINDKCTYIEKTWYIQVDKQRRTYLTYLCEINKIDMTGKIPRLKEGFNIYNEPTINDIEIISYADNMRKNSYLRYPEEVRKLIQLKGALNRQIHKQNG